MAGDPSEVSIIKIETTSYNIKDSVARTHIANSTVHVTSSDKTNWNNAATNSHTHSNKTVLDGIASTDITAWNSAATNSHTHSNKTLLDSYTQTETDLSDAVSKKHSHSNKTILDGISSANISSWNAAEPNVQADWSTTNSASDAFIKNKPSIPTATTTTPKMNGTAAVGSETTWAKGDHVHPVDTSRAASSHSHGNITNGGDMTATADIASGDRIVINDESASKLTSSTLTFGSSTTQYLANNGTWQNVPTFSQVQADWSTTDSSAASFIANKPNITTLAETAELSDAIPSTNYQTVSQAEKDSWNAKSTFSGNYSDLNGKPTIPTTLAQLASDTTHRVVTDAQINQWNNNYTLPSSGIPLNDLSQPVRDLLTNKTSLFESDIIIGDVYFKRYAAGRLMVFEVE